MKWNGLRYNWVPALLINGDSLFESGEEEVAFVEVAIEMFGDVVFLFETPAAVVVIGEGEVARLDLEVGAGAEHVVVLS